MTNILTPVGRLVKGDPFKVHTTGYGNKPLINKQGEPYTERFVGIAIPKTDPAARSLIDQIEQIAKAGYPSLFPGGAACTHPAFSWKYVDGDSTTANQSGKVPSQQEGYPGHYVFSFKTQYELPCYRMGAASQWERLVDNTQLKRGDYIRIGGGIVCGTDMAKPGVYLNPNIVEFVGHGEPIQVGPDPSAVFGATPAAMPPAASATPQAPAVGLAPPAAAGVQPATSFLNGPPPAPPAAAEPKYIHPSGQAHTRAQLAAAGWNDTQINALPPTP